MADEAGARPSSEGSKRVTRHCEILIPGYYYCDLIFTGIPGFPALGTEIYTENLAVVPGGCLNSITALRRLGVNVGWLSELGTDPFSHIIDEWVEREGISRDWLARRDAPFQRVTVALSYPHDRAFVTYYDKAPSLLDRVRQTVEAGECEHLHLTSLLVDPRGPGLLRACRARGIRVTMDCQHRDDTLADPLVRETLSLLDVFMPNATEALRLTGAPDVDTAARALLEYVPFLVIKDGERGAQAWRGGEHWQVDALRMAVVDTTGAGDVFNAGFLTAYRSGYDVPTCLQWGNICGGLSTTGYGGTSAAPTRAVVEQYLAASGA